MIAIYTRVSTTEQAQEGYSLQEQEIRLKSYCEAMKWDPCKLYTDPGYSGGSMNRPALQQLIRDVKAKKITRVVVYKLDRLSRSQKDTLYLIEEVFLANNCDFVSMTENLDTGSALGKAMIGILAVFAQLERETIKERMVMGKIARAKEGKWCGGSTPPYGYNYANDQLFPDEVEKLHVMEAFNLAERGWSTSKISAAFNRKGYTPKRGVNCWTDITIHRMLTNQVYIGKVNFYGEQYDGQHEPIISQEQFFHVQNIMKKRSEHYERFNPDPHRRVSYFGGYIRCARCGAGFQLFTANSKRNEKVYKYKYYVCNSRLKRKPSLVRDPSCKNDYWKPERLEEMVFGEIKKLTVDQVDDHHLTLRPEDIQKRSMKAELDQIDRKIQKLMELYMMDGIPKDRVQEQMNILSMQREQIQDEMNNIPERDMKEIKESIKNIPDILRHGTYEDIRDLISVLIDHISIDGQDLTIHWKF
jgi:site-specific DNA recombinase